MYKSKSKQGEANRASMKRLRAKGITEGITSREGITPDILLKLTDPFWRDRLAKLCDAFENSHHPEYKEDCWLGETNLSTACDYLECTT